LGFRTPQRYNFISK